MSSSFKSSEIFVVYRHNQYYTERPEQGLLFTTKAAAEEFARLQPDDKNQVTFKIATLDEFIADYGEFIQDYWYEIGRDGSRNTCIR